MSDSGSAENVEVAPVPASSLCGDPHPRFPDRTCTDPAGHAGEDLRGNSHGDGHVDRWLRR